MRARPRGPDTHPLTPRTHVDSLGDAIARFEWKLEGMSHGGTAVLGQAACIGLNRTAYINFLNGHHSNIY